MNRFLFTPPLKAELKRLQPLPVFRGVPTVNVEPAATPQAASCELAPAGLPKLPLPAQRNPFARARSTAS